MERWRRCVAENDDLERGHIQGLLTGEDEEEEEGDDVNEWEREDDADYPSRKKKRRMNAIGAADKHGTTFVDGHKELMSLARGIAEDIVNTDNVEVDLSVLTATIRKELDAAFKRVQAKHNSCSFQDIVNATRAYSMAQKAKPPKVPE